MSSSAPAIPAACARTDPARTTRSPHPLRLVLGYVGRHRAYAIWTLLFGTIGFALSFVYPWVTGSMVDLLTRPSSVATAFQERELGLLTLAAGFTALLHAAVVYGRGHANVHLGHSVVVDLRRALFEHLQRLSVGFYARARTGGLLSRVIHDVHEATSLIYLGIIVAALDAAQLSLAVCLLLRENLKLALACLLLFPLYALVFVVMNPRVRRASERMQAQFSRLTADVCEQIAGQALIKTYTAEAREIRRFEHALSRHHELVLAQSHLGHLVASAGEVLVHCGTTVVVGYGGLLALSGELSAGRLTRFLGYVMLMFGPVRRLAELNAGYQSSFAAIRRVRDILAIEPSVVEPSEPRREVPTHGHVRFENVWFRYDGERSEAEAELAADGDRRAVSAARSDYVLRNISLEARPGERIAIVGASGAGKSTLLALLPRLYDPSSGRVLVDGTSVREYSLLALRSAIGVVQQGSFLFTGTIRDNIAYGRPEASHEEIVAAARAAYADEFIERLPDGYHALLGERGVNLSGGQQQRLSIARALLKNPRILILDEATSSLDAASERAVQDALENLMRDRTCFIIAHRLSTIRHADRIVVLDQGRLVEAGRHDELVAAGGRYARLLECQTELG